jgi:hypothetical protein
MTFGVPTWFIQIRYHHDIAFTHEPGLQTLNAFIARKSYKVVRLSLVQTLLNPGSPNGQINFSEWFSHYGEPLKIKLPCNG